MHFVRAVLALCAGRSGVLAGLALDTDQFCVICCNVLGGCFGSTGPSAIDPETGTEYAMTFPMITISDSEGGDPDAACWPVCFEPSNPPE